MDILILAIIAVFILAKLFSVLGSGDSSDSIKRNDAQNTPQSSNNAVVNVDFKTKSINNPAQPAPAPRNPSIIEPEITDPELLGRISDIQKKDARFTPGTFLSGASVAYEMVVQAFNRADVDTLKRLLSAKVFDLFNREIETAIKQGSYPETTIVAMKESTIEKIEIVRNKVKIFVRFVAEEVNVLKDKEGNIVEGDPSSIQEISDQWVFERDLRSNDPNWTIVAT